MERVLQFGIIMAAEFLSTCPPIQIACNECTQQWTLNQISCALGNFPSPLSPRCSTAFASQPLIVVYLSIVDELFDIGCGRCQI